MPMVDPFTHDAFTMGSLTQSINILPNTYSHPVIDALFRLERLRTRAFYVEEYNGVLNLLPTMPPGSPGSVGKHGKRTVRSFVTSHIPHDDIIMPEAYADMRAFGSETELMQLSTVVNDRLQEMKNKHDITHRYHKVGALQGVIYDSDGSTLWNLFTEFGITKKTVDFLLGTSTTKVPSKIREGIRHIEDNLKGEIYTGIHCLLDETMFDAFVTHSSIKDAFLYHSAAMEKIGADPRKLFPFGGVDFEEYRGTATDADGTARKFIAANYGIMFPKGTSNTFRFVCSPADFNETQNTLGQVYYAKQESRKFDRGIDLHTQSNILPICKRPGVLVEVKTSN